MLDFAEDIQQYEVFDALGQVYLEWKVLNTKRVLKINLSDFSKELYFTRFYPVGYTKGVEKFIVI